MFKVNNYTNSRVLKLSNKNTLYLKREQALISLVWLPSISLQRPNEKSWDNLFPPPLKLNKNVVILWISFH